MSPRFRSAMLAAILLVVAGFAYSSQTVEICVGQPVPYGHVVTDHRWLPTRCESTPATQPNVLVLTSWMDLNADAELTVCASSPTPPGWVVTATRFDAVRCKLDAVPGRLDHNVKVIRRTGGAPGPGQGGTFVTGIFSDLRRSGETGDVVGTEVFLLAAADGFGRPRHYALVQFAEGVPETPQLVEVRVSGDRISFGAHLFGRRLAFNGRVTADALEGEFAGLEGRVYLPRGPSFWQ